VGDACWLGYQGDDLEATIDFGKSISISSLSSGYLQAAQAGVFFPPQVEYAVSSDGQTFEVVTVLENDVPVSDRTEQRKRYTIQGLDLDARFVRVRAKNLGVMPAEDDSRSTWLFVDEVMVNPVLVDTPAGESAE